MGSGTGWVAFRPGDEDAGGWDVLGSDFMVVLWAGFREAVQRTFQSHLMLVKHHRTMLLSSFRGFGMTVAGVQWLNRCALEGLQAQGCSVEGFRVVRFRVFGGQMFLGSGPEFYCIPTKNAGPETCDGGLEKGLKLEILGR